MQNINFMVAQSFSYIMNNPLLVNPDLGAAFLRICTLNFTSFWRRDPTLDISVHSLIP
jgi:hypothetical protein